MSGGEYRSPHGCWGSLRACWPITGNAPAGNPEINNATRSLRAAAAGKGDTERMSMWAGQGYRSALDRPAGEIIAWLSGEDGGTDLAGLDGPLP